MSRCFKYDKSLRLTLPTIKSIHSSLSEKKIEGGPKVYDVTNYLDDHPGGAEVMLDLAGKDADEFFEDIGHSNDARAELKKHLIGVLKLDEAEMARLKEQAEAAAKKKAESSSNMLIFVLILLLAIGIAYYKKVMS